MSDKIIIKSSDWKIEPEERSRGRMKFTIKLNKQETETFTVWKNTVKPPQMPDDDFYRRIFFGGVQSMDKFLNDAAAEMLKDPEVQRRLAEMEKTEQVENPEISETPVVTE